MDKSDEFVRGVVRPGLIIWFCSEERGGIMETLKTTLMFVTILINFTMMSKASAFDDIGGWGSFGGYGSSSSYGFGSSNSFSDPGSLYSWNSPIGSTYDLYTPSYSSYGSFSNFGVGGYSSSVNYSYTPVTVLDYNYTNNIVNPVSYNWRPSFDDGLYSYSQMVNGVITYPTSSEYSFGGDYGTYSGIDYSMPPVEIGDLYWNNYAAPTQTYTLPSSTSGGVTDVNTSNPLSFGYVTADTGLTSLPNGGTYFPPTSVYDANTGLSQSVSGYWSGYEVSTSPGWYAPNSTDTATRNFHDAVSLSRQWVPDSGVIVPMPSAPGSGEIFSYERVYPSDLINEGKAALARGDYETVRNVTSDLNAITSTQMGNYWVNTTMTYPDLRSGSHLDYQGDSLTRTDFTSGFCEMCDQSGMYYPSNSGTLETFKFWGGSN